MLKKIAIIVFILSSLALTACKEEQAKPKKEVSQAEREAATKKALETNFQKSAPKVWKAFD